MDNVEYSTVVQSAIESINDATDDEDLDEYLERLRFLFSENLIFAALDLVDRESVIHFKAAWGFSQYRVLGSTSTYSVYPGDASATYRVPAYCTCPAFAYSVLLSTSDLMCKHLLATMIARRLSKCISRPAIADHLAVMAVEQTS